jgi:hypothetical protein
MNIIDFSRLFQRHGGYSLPVLIELKHPEKISWYFTNNKTEISYKGEIFKPVPVQYKFPNSRDGIPSGGLLEIDIDLQTDGYEILKWFDEADHRTYMRVVGLINEGNSITEASQLIQKHGRVTWDGNKIVWTLGVDDRMNMQINAWVFDTDALTG